MCRIPSSDMSSVFFGVEHEFVERGETVDVFRQERQVVHTLDELHLKRRSTRPVRD
jgi:hypothetical protein